MHTPQTLRALTLAALLGATFAAHALPTDCKQPWPPAPQVTASATLNEGCSPLRQMLNPQPLPPRRGGAEVAKLNPQPLPPRRGGTAVALNPQPLPPRHGGFMMARLNPKPRNGQSVA